MKHCTKCGCEKGNDQFYKNGGGYLRPDCRECVLKRHKRNRDEAAKLMAPILLERKRQAKLRKAEYNRTYARKWRSKNPERSKEINKKSWRKNKHKYAAAQTEWYMSNKPRIAEYYRNRRKTDLRFRMKCALSSRIRTAIRTVGAMRKSRTWTLLGCDFEFFQEYIQARFSKGMNWNNYGTWHIDHIRPCASFDLLDANQQAQCFHYSNLQPLWSKDNRSKKDTIPKSHQAELI